MTRIMLTILAVVLLPKPIEYQGMILYPYYCTKTWVCDYVPVDVYLKHCQKRPCTTVR